MGTLLERLGYHPTIVLGVYDEGQLIELSPENINHCWVELGDHIIDVTATQFGENDEILFDDVEIIGSKFYPLIKTTVKDLKRDVTDWPKNQTPSLRNTKHILRAYQDITGENVGA